jgi:copper(I)-binding protein
MTTKRSWPQAQTRRASVLVPILMAVAAGAIVVLIVSSRSSGSTSPSGPPTIVDAYATPALIDGTTAVYFTANNPGAAEAITAVTTDVGESAAFYRSEDADGMSTMDAVDRLELPGAGAVTLAPGGVHVMAGPTRSELKPGDLVQVTVEFERSPRQTVSAQVRSFGEIAALGPLGAEQ